MAMSVNLSRSEFQGRRIEDRGQARRVSSRVNVSCRQI